MTDDIAGMLRWATCLTWDVAVTEGEIDGCVGRYGTVRQDARYVCGPRWYGQVVELHSSKLYARFVRQLKQPGKNEFLMAAAVGA